MKQRCLLILLLLSALPVFSQTQTPTPTASPDEKKWYDRFTIRGYIQARQNNIINTNDSVVCEQCDRSWGGTGGFSIRRARLTAIGEVYKNISFKLEADFATGINATNQNFSQVRDAYVDIGVDDANEYRIRIGQSKVPYGFENLQSSGVRLNMDRSDAINSAFLSERDLGAVFMWGPARIRKRFSDLVSQNFKGSGDFGVFALGIFNGQTSNRNELNKNQHVVARAAYPFEIGGQTIEFGIQGYSGRYVMYDTQVSPGTVTSHDRNYTDQRAGISAILFPKPFGIQAEYNIGKGPQFDTETLSVLTKSLQGGYVMFNYRLQNKQHLIFPYARYQYYQGGKKTETDARGYTVHQVDMGIEWQLNKYLEFSAEYVIANRRYADMALNDNRQSGNSLRMQAQVSF